MKVKCYGLCPICNYFQRLFISAKNQAVREAVSAIPSEKNNNHYLFHPKPNFCIISFLL